MSHEGPRHPWRRLAGWTAVVVPLLILIACSAGTGGVGGNGGAPASSASTGVSLLTTNAGGGASPGISVNVSVNLSSPPTTQPAPQGPFTDFPAQPVLDQIEPGRWRAGAPRKRGKSVFHNRRGR